MTREQALQIVIDIASLWGENIEEDFTRRIKAEDTDQECMEIAAKSGYETTDVVEVRDLWAAINLLQK